MKKEVLLIEDDKGYRALVRHFLSDEFEIHEAQSFAKGLELLSKKQIEVIIFDLILSDVKDEKDVIEALQQLKNFSNNRIIVLTGKPYNLDENEAEKFVFYYLEKNKDFSKTAVKFAIKHAFNDIAHKNLENLSEAQLAVQEQINLKNSVLSQVLSQICKSILQLTGCYTCHIRLFDQRRGDYKTEAYAGPQRVDAVFSLPSKPEDLYSGRAAATKETISILDLQNDLEFVKWKNEKLALEPTHEVKEYFEIIKSAHVVPISTGLFHNEVDAILNLSAVSTNFFTPDKEKTIDGFIKQIKMAVAKNWLDKKRWEVHDDYKQSSEILGRISQKLKGDYELDDIYDIAIEGISKIICPEMISIFHFNKKTGYLENVAEVVGAERVESDEKHLPGHDITGKVYKSRKAKRIPDENDKRNPLEHEWYDKTRKKNDLSKMPSEKIDHYLCVPMIIGDETLGVIRLINKKSDYYKELDREKLKDDPYCLLKRGFSTDCETVLGIIASHLAIAIQNANLFSRLTKRIEQQKSISEITRKIGAYYEGNEKVLLKEIVGKTAEVTNSSICMLFIRDNEYSVFYLKETYVSEELIKNASQKLLEAIKDSSYKLGEGYTGTVAETGISKLKEPNDNHKGKYDEKILNCLRESYGVSAQIESYMIAPIFIDSEITENGKDILGVLKVFNKKGDEKHFNKGDLSIFETFASQIGLAIKVTERNKELNLFVGGVEHEIRNSIGGLPQLVKDIRNTINYGDIKQIIDDVAIKCKKEREKTASSTICDVENIDSLNESLDLINLGAIFANDFADDILGFTDYKERGRIDIHNLLNSCISSLKGNINIQNYEDVKIFREYSPEKIFGSLYERPFYHSVKNILINAYHAMEERQKDGKLTINTYLSPDNQTVNISLTDNGTGISEENLSKIYRTDYTTKDSPKGNGLGLWFVEKSLKKMDGNISVESTLGEGTTFTISIPQIKE